MSSAALTTNRARGPARRLRALAPLPSVPTFAGTSRAVRELLERADRLAPTTVPLLLHGESGTGKEVLARRIHHRSRRSSGPFVAENCAAVSEALFESEFFGHAKGAFTGADRDREGLLQRASGGTLLLDEVGEMPPALQAKLLRVLEDGRVRPVGAEHEVEVDVRILSATNRDPAELVREGRFREDLLYRLQGVRIDIPPLRERPEDVVTLARTFLAELDRDHGTNRSFAPGQLQALARHPWPGNSRELRNVVSLAYHWSDGDRVEVEEVLTADRPTRRPDPGHGLLTRVATLAEVEREAIVLALAECGGDRREAARILGISRSSIYDRIRRHGVEHPVGWVNEAPGGTLE